MESALKIEINEEMVCGVEHHMNKQFTDALCTMLKLTLHINGIM